MNGRNEFSLKMPGSNLWPLTSNPYFHFSGLQIVFLHP